MSKPFDATINAMIDLRASQWADCFSRVAGVPPGPSTPLDTDLATSLQADRVFRIDGERPYVLHLEFESNPRRGIPAELLRYNSLILNQHDLPVETVLILLRPKAVVSDMTGRFQQVGVTGKLITDFKYHVEKVWERPAEFWLKSGIGLAALSVITNEAKPNLEANLSRLDAHVQSEGVDEGTRGRVISAAYFLCGLRYNPVMVEEIFRRLNMLLEDSTTYQAVLTKGKIEGKVEGKAEGTIEGEHKVLLRQGIKRFGPPNSAIAASLKAITDTERLDGLAERILDVGSWDELLAGA